MGGNPFETEDNRSAMGADIYDDGNAGDGDSALTAAPPTSDDSELLFGGGSEVEEVIEEKPEETEIVTVQAETLPSDPILPQSQFPQNVTHRWVMFGKGGLFGQAQAPNKEEGFSFTVANLEELKVFEFIQRLDRFEDAQGSKRTRSQRKVCRDQASKFFKTLDNMIRQRMKHQAEENVRLLEAQKTADEAARVAREAQAEADRVAREAAQAEADRVAREAAQAEADRIAREATQAEAIPATESVPDVESEPAFQSAQVAVPETTEQVKIVEVNKLTVDEIVGVGFITLVVALALDSLIVHWTGATIVGNIGHFVKYLWSLIPAA